MVSESFKSRANEAAFWESWVGACLTRKGLYVLHHPFLADGLPGHELSWDLDVCFSSEDEPCAFLSPVRSYRSVGIPVEVKSRDLVFNGPSDYPFDEVNVCSQNSFLRKHPGSEVIGRDFIIVSTKTGCMAWLPKMSKVSLGKETYDTKRGEVFKVVTASKADLRSFSDFCSYAHGN